MDKALLDFEVSIDADCKLLTVGKPFAIEGTHAHTHTLVFLITIDCILLTTTPWFRFKTLLKTQSYKIILVLLFSSCLP